jgi:hypothetical protein
MQKPLINSNKEQEVFFKKDSEGKIYLIFLEYV